MISSYNENGISPVIGVILMVSVTIALVALVSVIAFNIGQTNPSSSSGVALSTSQTSNGVECTVIRQGNADNVKLKGPDSKVISVEAEAGNTVTMGDGAGSYSCISVMEDGKEEVTEVVDVDEGSPAAQPRTATGTTSGIVSINPPIQGAKVQSIEDGVMLDEATTDSNGQYTVDSSNSARIRVVIDGFDSPELSNTLYGGATRTNIQGSNADFTFSESQAKQTVVDDKTILTSYTIDEETNNVNPITSLEQLQAMQSDLDANYILVNNIDATETQNWNDGGGSANGFDPIGVSDSEPFTGSLDGNGHQISNLFIDRESSKAGLFRSLENNVQISDLGLINVDITGGSQVGAIAGNPISGTVSNAYATGDISGSSQVGGLTGRSYVQIKNSYAKVDIVSSGSDVGGISGQNYADVSNSYATGSVSGSSRVGGLIGNNFGSATLSNVSSSGNVDADFDVGGLIGSHKGVIENSHSSSSVDGSSSVGGLAGSSFNGEIFKSYSTGTVSGSSSFVGGLVGDNNGDISESYSSSTVNGNDEAGGLVGFNRGSISKTYATGDVSGTSRIGGLVGNIEGGSVDESYSIGDTPTTGSSTGALIGKIGEDSDIFNDIDHTAKDIYVLEDSEQDDSDKVIGQIVEGKGEGDVIIKQGTVDIANNGSTTVSDVEQELIDEIVRSESEFKQGNNIDLLDSAGTWSNDPSTSYPFLQAIGSEVQVQD